VWRVSCANEQCAAPLRTAALQRLTAFCGRFWRRIWVGASETERTAAEQRREKQKQQKQKKKAQPHFEVWKEKWWW
jgi:hypothetical protein